MKTKSVKFYIALAIAGSVITSCSKKNPPVPEKPGKYIFATIEGTGTASKTYYQTLENLNGITVDNTNATEIPLNAAMYNFGKSAFFVTSAPPTMLKFTSDDDGKLTAGGTFVGEGTRTFSKPTFRSETEAYVAVYGQNQLIKFNPTTMQKTGEIDLTALYRKNASNAVVNIFFSGGIIRDDKLFLPIMHERVFLQPLIDSVFIAIFDLKAGKLEKLIRDERSNRILSTGRLVEVLIMDENKDIYVQAFPNGFTKPSGIFRIKAGQTEFDKDYFWDLNATTGSYCFGLYYFGKDLAFTCRVDPTATSFNSFNWKFNRIDLANKKIIGEVPGLPLVNASASSFIRQFEKDKLIFNVRASNENALYEYDIPTNTSIKKLTATSGTISGVDILK